MTERLGWVYRLYSADGALLYVGSCGDLYNRFNVHERQNPWWNKVAVVRHSTWLETLTEARALEVEIIREELPLLNQQHNPRYAGETRKDASARVARVVERLPVRPLPEPIWINDGAAREERAMRDAMDGIDARYRRSVEERSA